jgi:hypothetical protein
MFHYVLIIFSFVYQFYLKLAGFQDLKGKVSPPGVSTLLERKTILTG